MFTLILLLKSGVLFRPAPDGAAIPGANTYSKNGKSAGVFPNSVPHKTPCERSPFTPAGYGCDPLLFFSTAPRDSLILLPGIGPVLADRIINARNGKRLFNTWDDLRAVKGIGAKKIEKFKRLAAAE